MRVCVSEIVIWHYIVKGFILRSRDQELTFVMWQTIRPIIFWLIYTEDLYHGHRVTFLHYNCDMFLASFKPFPIKLFECQH